MSGQNHSITIDVAANISQAVGSIRKIQEELNKLKLSPNMKNSFDTNFKGLYKEIEKYQDLLAKGPKTKAEGNALERSGNNILKIYGQIVKEMNSLDGSALKNAFKDLGAQEVEKLRANFENLKRTLGEATAKTDFGKNLATSFQEVKKELEGLDNEASNLINKLGKTTFKRFSDNLFGGRLDLAENNLKSIQKQISELDNEVQGKDQLVKWVNDLSTSFQQLKTQGDISPLIEQLGNLKNSLSGEQAKVIDQLIQKFNLLKQEASQTGEILTKTNDTVQKTTKSQIQLTNELGQVKNRIQYFLGLSNAINLFKRAIRSSFNTIKELDKAMTETAVVTDYTIKDMWKQLPEYTKRANQLGVTTKEAYESATLYYQQGLNTEQAAALSTETLKMARIAGLDAADATDRMTNALRGFNMELNATQAQRVDDVYSQLAAMSASNVDEISTAMTKVASLANNANMEFETTAAFLAQIIESTRESAETAGTALKTVVARFSEVKKLYDKEELKGQDEEGQVIDVNKVSAALRTAGIDLNKYFLGEVGLDDIFIELASKWDSLTNIQQRYIATQAAGSRQQSRFIALMADYARTQELVGAAYNSTGASQKQFEKTQDSMQSKLARLKNAWDEFAMGLANNAVLKGVVDALTALLQIINKVTSAFGDGVGSVLKWTAAISALSGVRKLFMGGGFIDKALGTALNGTILGNTLFKGGILSGGATAANSTTRQVVEEAARQGTRPTVVTTGGLRGLFGNFKQRRAARLEAFNTYSAARGTVLDSDEFYNDLPGLGKLGLKVNNSKLLGGVSKKLAGTKFAGGLSKLLGFGSSGAGAAAAAGLATALGAVAAAAAAAYGAYKLWEHFSPEGQLKQATEFSKAMDQAAESAKKAKESTKEAYDTYIEKDKAINKATTIAGRNKAIEDRNTYVNELLKQNDSYAKYLKTTFKDGKLELTLDEKALKNVADEAEKAATQTAFGADLAKAMQANKQANVYRADIRRAGANTETGTIREYDEHGFTYQRQMTNKEQAKYSNLETKAMERDAVAKGFAKSAFSKMVDGETLGNELGELVTGALTETFDANKYYNTVNSSEGGRGWSWLRRRSVWQQKYQEAYGVEADSSMKTADIARAVAQKTAQDQQKNRADTLSELVKSNKEAYEPLLKAINGTFDGKVKLDTDASALIDDLTEGIDLKVFADAIGKTPEELKTILESNIKAQKEIYANNIKNLALKGQKAGVSRGFFSQLLSMNPDQVADILGFADAAEKSLGDDFTSFLDNLDVSQLDSYKEFFSGFDLDEPLQAVKKLNEAINDKTNPTIQELATNIKRANQPLFDTGYLTQFFMTSEAYEGISESLEKFIEDNKEITADNIEELAKSCSDLKTLLDETDANAQGLARAFTAVASGEASIDGITSAVLETLGATQSANTAIDKLFKTIDEFDAGRDFGKAVDFAISKIEELEKSLENLDFGNETFKKNYEYFFTDKDYKDFIAKDTAGRKTMLEGQINRIKGLLDNDALGAMRELASKSGSGVTGDINGFDFTWDVQNWTWDDAVGKIQEYLNVNEQIASTILTAAAKHIPGLTEQLDLNGFEKDITLFNQKISQQALVTEQELQVLAQAYGKDVEQLWKDLQDNAKKNGIELPARISWQGDDGNNLTGKELLDKARQTYNTTKFKIDAIRSRQVYDDDGYETIGGFDPTKLTTAIQNSLKVNAAQAREIANDYVKSVNGQFEQPVQIPYKVVNEDGSETWDLKTEIVQASDLEGLEAKVKLLEDQAQWTAYGEAMKTAITEALGNITPGGSADNVISDIETQLAGHTFTVNVKGNYVGIDGAPGGDSTDNTSRGNAEAKGGIVSSYASGARHIKPGVALTGEEGPELIWNKQGGYAYLVGKHGPEFANLVPGDQVFPADETKDIIRRGVTPSLAKGGKVVPAYAEHGSWKDPNGGKGNGDKKKEDTEGAKLDLDKYYNLVEDINELLRLRNLLEKDYEQLLKNEGKTGKEIYDNLTRQLDLLEERRKIVEDLAQKRKQQILDLVEENKEYGNYAWWNDSDQTIEIDWDAVQKIEDKDTASAVKDYLSKLEDFQGKYDDMIEQLEEIESQVQEIKKRGKEQYDSLEERVRDALIKQIQDKIDELTEVDKAINETNQKLFNSMQDTLEKQRQQRENKKTEEDLTDKEKRLAYLQQDSSNANALEIAKLQKELADARQDYTDNLIDQKISELQKQNDEAQEQRQEQIDLMQRSLDWQEKSGAFWETVYKYISEGTDEIGTLVHGSELENLLKSAEPWDKLSEEQRKSWVNELLDQVAQGIAYLELTRQLEDIGTKKGTEVTFTTAGEKLKGELNENGQVELEDSSGKKFTGEDIGGGNVRFTDEDGNLVGYGKVDKDGKVEFQTAGQTLTGTVDKDGNVVVTNPDGSTVTYKDVFQDYNGAYRTFETEGEAKKKKEDYTNTTGGNTGGDTGDGNSNNNNEGDDEYYHFKDTYEHVSGSSPSHHQKIQLWYKYYRQGQPLLSSEKRVKEGGPTPCSFNKYDRSNEAYERWEYICPKCHYSYTTEQKRTNHISGGGCFVAGTQILMTDYTTKNIEDIKIGDIVIAYNENINQFESRKVIKSYQHYNTPRVIEVILSNGVILGITPGHPIFTLDGWKSRDLENSLYEHGVKATWLNVGDIVISQSGEAKVLEINEINIPNNYITYNIEVETCHTYLADGIVVHNAKANAVKGYASGGSSGGSAGSSIYQADDRFIRNGKLKGVFATGGIADFTGPAWLDGSKSHPELVLNARDTQNFIELKDVLDDMRKNGGFSLTGGDNYYDIKVQVDSLSSDYDVDRAIDRIKARIAQDGAYRNVNTLSRLR